MPSLAHVLKGIESVLRQEILKGFRPDSCIATTRAVIRVLRNFGYHAEPFAVTAIVLNPTMAKYVEAGTNLDAGDPGFKQWCKETGAWSVGVGGGEVDARGVPGYGGHLVAILPHRNILIDASIDQAARPAKQIHFPRALIGPYPAGFLEGGQLHLHADNGSVLIYEKIVNESFRTSPDWKDKTRTRAAVKQTIKYINAGL
jgi:hypothetical protein